MVGKISKDKNGWCIIHEEAAGPFVWRTPYRIVPGQELPEEWNDGDMIEFNLNAPSFDSISITDPNFQTLILEII